MKFLKEKKYSKKIIFLLLRAGVLVCNFHRIPFFCFYIEDEKKLDSSYCGILKIKKIALKSVLFTQNWQKIIYFEELVKREFIILLFFFG